MSAFQSTQRVGSQLPLGKGLLCSHQLLCPLELARALPQPKGFHPGSGTRLRGELFPPSTRWERTEQHVFLQAEG